MRNREEEGLPLVNIERNPLVLIIFGLLTAAIGYYNVYLFKNVEPLAFMMMTPTVVIFVQTLWLILTPFAMIYEDRIEFRQSFFHQKRRFFIDLKQVARNKNGKFFIVYNDDEVEAMNLFGIRASHVSLLKSELEKFVEESKGKRTV